MKTYQPLYHSTLGFDNILADLERLAQSTYVEPTKYPPHNIIKINDNEYIVELSVSGFSKDDIEIVIENNILTIKGEKKTETNTSYTYIHKGIAARSFAKSIKLIDTVEVKYAEFVDGILRIYLINIIPAHKLPRRIEITSGTPALTDTNTATNTPKVLVESQETPPTYFW
jgi:molecular chaperone IbpA